MIRRRLIHPKFDEYKETCKFIPAKFLFHGGYAAGQGGENYYTPQYGFYGWKFTYDAEEHTFIKKLDANYVVYAERDGYCLIPDVVIKFVTTKDGKFWQKDEKRTVPIEKVEEFLSKDKSKIAVNRYLLNILTNPVTATITVEKVHPVSKRIIKDSQGYPEIDEKTVTTPPFWELVEEIRSTDPTKPEFDYVYPCFRSFFSKSHLQDGWTVQPNTQFEAPQVAEPEVVTKE
jgi:hypothetical protein